jgi:hypothetical protein
LRRHLQTLKSHTGEFLDQQKQHRHLKRDAFMKLRSELRYKGHFVLLLKFVFPFSFVLHRKQQRGAQCRIRFELEINIKKNHFNLFGN